LAEVTYISTLVQGAGAKEDIVKNIEQADAIGVDVIILGRGGGSIEDLWAFNEAAVVEAIYNARTPIISAVGHETDTTLSDFVADLRAPTPTGAAVLATPDVRELDAQINKAREFMNHKMNNILRHQVQHLNQLENYYIFKNPYMLVEQKVQRIDEIQNNMKYLVNTMLQQQKHRSSTLTQHITPKTLEDKVKYYHKEIENKQHQMDRIVQYLMSMKQTAFQSRLALLSSLSPTETLLRGYSITRYNDAIVRSVDDVKIGDRLEIEIKDGKLISEVIEKK